MQQQLNNLITTSGLDIHPTQNTLHVIKLAHIK